MPALACTAEFAVRFERAQLEQERRRLLALPVRANLAPIPREIRDTVDESLAVFAREQLLDPIRRPQKLIADIYLGAEFRRSLEAYTLPRDARTPCHLIPGAAVFLSDGFQHHYAVVLSVDKSAQTVTLLDPWAANSFLREGLNLAGVKGTALLRSGEPSRLVLSFRDFVRVARGLAYSGGAAHGYFEFLLELDPGLGKDADFAFWRAARILGTGTFEDQILLLVNGVGGPGGTSGEKLLEAVARDMTVGLSTIFGAANGTPAEISAGKAALTAMLGRFPDYARQLPWIVIWRLAQKIADIGTADVAAAAIEALLAGRPDDLDLRLLRAEMLAREGRLAELRAEMPRLEALFETEIARIVAVSPPAAAMAYFRNSPHPRSTLTFSINHWRLARIELAKLALRAGQEPKEDTVAAVTTLARTYPGSLALDFQALLQDVFSRLGAADVQRDLLRAAIEAATDEDGRHHVADSIGLHALSTTPISAFWPAGPAREAGTAIRDLFCRDFDEGGRQAAGEKPQLRDELKRFCAAAR